VPRARQGKGPGTVPRPAGGTAARKDVKRRA
jgi:hypothetical protein